MIVDIAWKTTEYSAQIDVDVANKGLITDISKIFEGMKGRVTLSNTTDYIENHMKVWDGSNPTLHEYQVPNEYAIYRAYFTDGAGGIYASPLLPPTLREHFGPGHSIDSLAAEVVTACNWLVRNHGIVSLRMES